MPILYIPHGSDESLVTPVSADIDSMPLYPTWFRWKSLSSFFLSIFFLFISHMVQMKAQSGWFHSDNGVSLYPTWFRWKNILNYFFNCLRRLYIPHGSDESIPWCPTSLMGFECFISHMVQMKDRPVSKTSGAGKTAFISHMVQMKVRLDDTAIWNKIWLYIPHGSDESATFLAAAEILDLPLYPTWFRWKIFLNMYKLYL